MAKFARSLSSPSALRPPRPRDASLRTTATLAPISTLGPSGPSELPPPSVMAAAIARVGAIVQSLGGRALDARSDGMSVPPSSLPCPRNSIRPPIIAPAMAGANLGSGSGRLLKTSSSQCTA